MSRLPLSLYLHLPWCVRKCPYCDFNSHSSGGDAPTSRYVDALLIDLEREAQRARGRVVETIFLGGGTPSLFPPAAIGRLLDGAARCLTVAADAEVTMEANPGTVECGSPAGYRAAGVNRLSVGAQSFNDASLREIGRIHNSDDVRRSVAEAAAAGFDNINIDLMYALPQQTIEMAQADVEAALLLEPTHISRYQLTLEPNTVFHARPPDGLPDEELSWDMQDAGAAMLGDAGFSQYEVSAWARDGRECRHNLNYWRFGDYLAAGAGSHGKLSGPGGVFRYAKPANPLQYVKSIANGEGASMHEVGETDRLFEFMLNALRLVGGFDAALFSERTGLPDDVLTGRLEPLLERGLLAQTGPSRWRPTATGRRFLNDLQAHFLP